MTPLMPTRLDHIVIAARTLEQGAAYIHEKMGITIPDGGVHDMMGTFNKVMSLGHGVYLEVIAIHPEMRAPSRPRWFGLDDPHVRNSLDCGPKLLTWAVNTDSLDSLLSGSDLPLGTVVEARRDHLKWKVALTEDGRMPGAGFIPLCIEWLVDFHPSEQMSQPDCQFKSFRLYHPRRQWLEEALKSIGAGSLVDIHEIEDSVSPYMELVVDGPHGEIVISSITQR
ncbi:MAG: VOC family protein [Gammaproteobacteria bacterium]|nr:VOC family protein [Gammaproteobacteria bacterium]